MFKATQKRKKIKLNNASKSGLFNFLNKRKRFFLILFSLGIILSIGLMISNNFFKIKNVYCLIDNNPCASVYFLDIENIKKQNLFNFDKDYYRQLILIRNPTLAQVDFIPKYPNSLILKIQERQAEILLKSNNLSYLVDANAYVIRENIEFEDQNLVVFLLNEPIYIGQKIVSPAYLAAYNIQLLLNQSELLVTQIKIENLNNIEVNLSNGLLVFFNGEKDWNNQVDSLKFILKNNSRTQIDTKLKSIDLRFNDPILR